MQDLIANIKGVFSRRDGFFSPAILMTVFVVLIMVVFALFFAYSQIKTYLASLDDKKPVTITIWGTRDDTEIIDLVGQAYKKLHPNVTVKYVRQAEISYRTRTQTQIADGAGPDIFMFYNKWLPMLILGKTLSPSPDTVFTASNFSQIFYPVAADDLVKAQKVYGIPIDANGLVLYYNQDIIKAQGLSVPLTWKQFDLVAHETTVRDPQTQVILTAGAGMGSTSNVDYWSDLLGLLFFQEPNTSPYSPNNDKGGEVLNFFSKFAIDDQSKVWDSHFDSTTQAFIQGKLTFYFAPLEKAIEIKQANPNLHFATAPIPQLTDDKKSAVYWARYLSYGVAKSSKSTNQAWKFLQFLSDTETQKYIFEQVKNKDGVGMPYARKDMQSLQANDPILGAFVNQGPGYKSWYLESATDDQGLNDEMVKNFKSAFDRSGSLSATSDNISGILNKYGAYP